MENKRKRPFFKQRPTLYFDENFPVSVIEEITNSSYWKKKYKILNATKLGNKGKPDEFHYFPFGKMPGIIIVRAGKNENKKIKTILNSFLEFINLIPLPKNFLGDSKFIISSGGCVMWGRDASTRETKKYYITAGKTTIGDVRKHFTY